MWRRSCSAAILAAMVLARSALAADFVVDSTGDEPDLVPGDGLCAAASGACTLRAAIEEVNELDGDDRITFDLPGPPPWRIELATALPAIEAAVPTIGSGLVLEGPGRDLLVIDGKQQIAGPVLWAFNSRGPAGTVTIRGLTLTGGGPGFNGRGLDLGGRFLTAVVEDCAIVDNGSDESSRGGGVNVSSAVVRIERCEISGNTAVLGAGIEVGGTLDLYDSTLSDNLATTSGAAMRIPPVGEGQALNVLRAVNVTVSGNRSLSSGSGIECAVGALGCMVSLEHVTITDNEGMFGSALEVELGLVELLNSISAGNRSSAGTNPDCAAFELTGGGAVHSLGGNLIGFIDTAASGGDCGIVDGVDDDRVGTPASPLDALLDELADNGGPTLTHLPLAGSPAIDAGVANGCAATDQRGVARPQDGDGNGSAVCDRGAVELLPEPGVELPALAALAALLRIRRAAGD
ncbi:MAG: choice-of-anchor Q domain-containing protein [Myxococcota bacterium]|nr:choice-of-anchor Q domain-containing protein [Myxococcota bacterium]